MVNSAPSIHQAVHVVFGDLADWGQEERTFQLNFDCRTGAKVYLKLRVNGLRILLSGNEVVTEV